MKLTSLVILSLSLMYGTAMSAGCAVEPSDAPLDDGVADPTTQVVALEASSRATGLEGMPLDGRLAAAAEVDVQGLTAAAVHPESLTSSWFSGSVAPGGIQHWFWNNASLTAAFKVGLSPIGASTVSACQFEVIRTWDSQQHTGEREFHFQIKNTGAIACGTNILLASQQRFTTWSTGGIAPGASQSWTWNNANPATAAHIVGVSPTGSTSTSTCDIEVTRTYYLEQPSGEREFHFTLKNAGLIACQGDIQLASTVNSNSSWSSGTLAPGASSSWVWNNANPLDRVYVPGLVPAGASTTTPCQLEVTRTGYQQFINASGTTERKFNLTITNVGALSCSGTFLLNYL